MTPARELAALGAFEFTAPVFADERGTFSSPYEEATFLETTGEPLFRLRQMSVSRSTRGVVRGVHFTAVPPGNAKYVYCPSGRVLDIVVDLRIGSPTFGRWDTVMLDPRSMRAVYLPVGLGHAFVSLMDATVVAYLLSASYVQELELAVSVYDPALALPLPTDVEHVLSERDRTAPTVAEAAAAGILPYYDECQRVR